MPDMASVWKKKLTLRKPVPIGSAGPVTRDIVDRNIILTSAAVTCDSKNFRPFQVRRGYLVLLKVRI